MRAAFNMPYCLEMHMQLDLCSVLGRAESRSPRRRGDGGWGEEESPTEEDSTEWLSNSVDSGARLCPLTGQGFEEGV